jgi:hypothetical protein
MQNDTSQKLNATQFMKSNPKNNFVAILIDPQS